MARIFRSFFMVWNQLLRERIERKSFGCVQFELKAKLQSGKVMFPKKHTRKEAMASNSQDITQDIRVQFEQLLDFVTGDEARYATADRIERGLFKLLVQLGYQLLQLFLMMRSETSSREPLMALYSPTKKTRSSMNEIVMITSYVVTVDVMKTFGHESHVLAQVSDAEVIVSFTQIAPGRPTPSPVLSFRPTAGMTAVRQMLVHYKALLQSRMGKVDLRVWPDLMNLQPEPMKPQTQSPIP